MSKWVNKWIIIGWQTEHWLTERLNEWIIEWVSEWMNEWMMNEWIRIDHLLLIRTEIYIILVRWPKLGCIDVLLHKNKTSKATQKNWKLYLIPHKENFPR